MYLHHRRIADSVDSALLDLANFPEMIVMANSEPEIEIKVEHQYL